MPDLCYNQISINLPEVDFYEDGVGSQAMRQNRWDMMKKLRDELDELDERADSEGFELLNILRPEPKDIGDDWYEWRSNNWGTKWSRLEGHQLEPDLHLVQFSLETAWGPPLEFCDYLTTWFGFEVRCLWSVDCGEWGIWEYGDIVTSDHIERWSEDDFDELRDLLEDCVDDDRRLELLMARGIFGSFEDRNNYNDHDVEWLETEFEWAYVQTLEDYNEWLENQPEDDREPLIKIKQRLLERAEELLEWGKITEGQYLKACDHLKKVTREEIEEFRDMFEPIADNYSIDYSQDEMIDYYKKGGEEPNLIDCYC
jgi:hypothetical protein